MSFYRATKTGFTDPQPRYLGPVGVAVEQAEGEPGDLFDGAVAAAVTVRRVEAARTPATEGIAVGDTMALDGENYQVMRIERINRRILIEAARAAALSDARGRGVVDP